MKANPIFEQLSVEDCHKPVLADVAWLRMVYQHLTQASTSLHNKNNSERDRIDNCYGGLDNAIVYIENMLHNSIEEKEE